jgi:hypothetical protein
MTGPVGSRRDADEQRHQVRRYRQGSDYEICERTLTGDKVCESCGTRGGNDAQQRREEDPFGVLVPGSILDLRRDPDCERMGQVCSTQTTRKEVRNMALAVEIVRAVLTTAFVVLGGLELYELVPRIYRDVTENGK